MNIELKATNLPCLDILGDNRHIYGQLKRRGKNTIKLLNRFFSNCAQYVDFDNQSSSAESERGNFRKCNASLSNLMNPNGSLGPSHQRRYKSWVSFRGPPCAHGVLGTPHEEVCDKCFANVYKSLLIFDTNNSVCKNCKCRGVRLCGYIMHPIFFKLLILC